MKRIIRIIFGTQIGLIHAIFPVILASVIYGTESYAAGFMTCLLAWWFAESLSRL